MQQRGANSVNMENEFDDDQSSLQAARGRNYSKLANKLVRSHAMREEASPPRDALMAASVGTTSDQNDSKSPSPCATSSPNTLSPPPIIQRHIRSPDTPEAATAHSPCATTTGNPLLVLSPSTSPSDSQTNISSEVTSSHSMQCYYHHYHHQCQQQGHTIACPAQHPPNNGGVMAARRCCSPPQQQKQMLVTVDYVGNEYAVGAETSADDRLTGGATSHKMNKLNRQNVDLCPTNGNGNKQQRHAGNTAIIPEESSQQTKVATLCDCSSSSSDTATDHFHHHHQSSQVAHSGGGSNLTLGNSGSNQLSVTRATNNRAKLRQQSSSSQSYGSFDGSHSSLSLSVTPSISRDNSAEQYTDTTGVDLDAFIPETLNRNAKDRALMLRIEEELVSLAKDQNRTHYKFPPMSSYQRMLVHRCAAYFGMDHNIESSGKCVVVNRTKATRIPSVAFREHLRTDAYLPPVNYSGSAPSLAHSGAEGVDPREHTSSIVRRSILKRGDNSGGSMDEINGGGGRRDLLMLLGAAGGGDKRSKSFEEREEEYVKARRRIFNPMIDQDHRGGVANDEFRWSDVRWPSTDSDMSIKNKLHPVDHYHPHRCRPGGRLQKVQSEEKGDDTLRPCVAKSYSFGGYGGCFTRNDSIMSTHSASPRLFTKQDSTTSSSYQRLSPSSSGYKTQSSQRSTESVTPSPTSTPYPSNNNTNTSTSITQQQRQEVGVGDMGGCAGGQMVFWAVTDVDSVPRGSVIINPQTGLAVRNDDGTVYRYDPGNPPVGMTGAKCVNELTVEKHTNYIETKTLAREPVIEEPQMCPNEMQHCDGVKSPLSPSHHYHRPLDVVETVVYHQHHHQQQQEEEEEEDVPPCAAQSGTDSQLTLVHNSPTHSASPQHRSRRKKSPFTKQGNFVQTSVERPIMVSTYTSTTNSPSPPSYSPHRTSPIPPTTTTTMNRPPTPLPSRPSSVLSQHTQQTPTIPNNNNTPQQHHHYHQQRYGAPAYHMLPVEQPPPPPSSYLGATPMYQPDGGIVYGPGVQSPQQPCFVYGYGVPTAPYNQPMENGMGEVGGVNVAGYYIADGAGATAITYQTLTPAAWANQISYFAAPAPSTVGPAAPTPRFSLPMHAQPASYLYNSHHTPSNYLTCPGTAPAQLAPTPTDLMPLYSPVPGAQAAVLFSQHAAAVNVTAPCTNGSTPMYPGAIFAGANTAPPYTPPPHQQYPLPPPVMTPQLQQYYSASSAASTPTGHGAAFSYPICAPTPPIALATPTSSGRPMHHLDRRNSMQRLNKIASVAAGVTSGRTVAPFVQGGSGRGSTEPNSPANQSIIPPTYPGGNGTYRLPTGADTPPITAHTQPFLPPHCNNMLIRPMNATVHSSPPVATMGGSSRSPTPACSDSALVVADRPKFPTVPTAYHSGATLPLIIPADTRLAMRGPSGPFRQLSPHQVRPQQQQQQQIPGVDRTVRGRRPR